MNFRTKLVKEVIMCSMAAAAVQGEVINAGDSIPKVLLIGHGFMGRHYRRNLCVLQEEGKVSLVGVVDIRKERLNGLDVPTFFSVKAALKATKPDIVAVVTNTPTHYEVIQEIFQAYAGSTPPALFVEKAIVEDSDQAARLHAQFQEKGYGRTIPFTCGYLFRQSAAVRDAIDYIKNHSLEIARVTTTWQKMRKPTRLSPGVHVDESTHSIDLIRYLFEQLGLANDRIVIHSKTMQRNPAIVDQVQQLAVYGEGAEQLNPVAEVSYQMTIGAIPVEGLSSFMRPPQIRQLSLHFTSGRTLTLSFDEEGNQRDRMTVTDGSEVVFTRVHEKPNKLRDEWRKYLQAYAEGRKEDDGMVVPENAFFDVLITEALGQDDLPADYELQNPYQKDGAFTKDPLQQLAMK